MAKKQYRWSGLVSGQSMSGNALVAIQNNLGSSTKVSINRMTIHNNTRVYQGYGFTRIALVRHINTASASSGTALPCFNFDTTKTLPTGIRVVKDLGVTADAGDRVIQYMYLTDSNKLAAFNRLNTSQKDKFNVNAITSRNDSVLENTILRPGECVSLTNTTPSSLFQSGTNLRQVSIKLKVDVSGTISHHTFVDFIDFVNTDNQACLVIQNDHGSALVHIKSIEITEAGALDTPYLQLVPVGAVNPQSQSDTTKRANFVPTDSAYGTTTAVSVFLDAPLLPFGVPQEYITPGSTGSPKGFNYLNTKDFDGPRFFSMFPEYNGRNGIAATTQNLVNSPKNSLISPGSPLVIRPGEAVALVSGAETAVVTTPVGTSGWMNLFMELVFSVEPSTVITLTGLKNPSEIRVFEAGTTTEVPGSGAENVTSGSHSFTLEGGLSVDIAILSLGYQNTRILNYSSSTSASIPVSQVIDRQYANT